jgi:hypothetical protein
MYDTNFLSVTASDTVITAGESVVFTATSNNPESRYINWSVSGVDPSELMTGSYSGVFYIDSNDNDFVYITTLGTPDNGSGPLPSLSSVYNVGGAANNVAVDYRIDADLDPFNDYWVTFYAHKDSDFVLDTDAMVILRGQGDADDVTLSYDDLTDNESYIAFSTNQIERGASYTIELVAGSLIEADRLTITFYHEGHEQATASVFIQDTYELTNATELFDQIYTINNDFNNPDIIDFGFVSATSNSNSTLINYANPLGLTNFIPFSDADELISVEDNPHYLYFTFDSDLVQSNWWGQATDIKVFLGTDTTGSADFTLDTDLYSATGTGFYWDVDLETNPPGATFQHENGIQVDGDTGLIDQNGNTLIFRIDEEMFELGQTYTLVANIGAMDFGDNVMTASESFTFTYGQAPTSLEFLLDPSLTIADLEDLTPSSRPLNTLVLPYNAGDVYFEFGEDGTGLLLPTDTTVWTELAQAGSVTFNAGFNGITAGDGNDSLFGSDAHSEVFAPGSFTTVYDEQGNIDYEGGNLVYGGDDENNDTIDYVDYRLESEFANQTVEAIKTVDVPMFGGTLETHVATEMREFNGVVLALEDNNGGDGFATVQRSADQLDEFGVLETAGAFDEISSIEGVLGSLKNDFLDASQIGASGAVLAGFEGNDLLIGSDSDDVLVGGSGNDILVAGNDLLGVNYLEGGTGRDTIVASDAKDLFFVRIGDGNETISSSGPSSAKEQVVDFQLSGDSAKFVGRDNLVKDEFLFVSDSTVGVIADFNNVTKTLSISSGNNSYNVTVDIKTESGTPTPSYFDAITQRTVNYTVSAFVVQEQPIPTEQVSAIPTEQVSAIPADQVHQIVNNAPDLSGALLAGSAYSSVLADTAQSVTRVGLLRQRMGEIIDKVGIADAVVGGRDDDIIVLSGKGSAIKGDLAIGGQGSDLYEVRMVSDLRSLADTTPIEHDKITIREMGARGVSNNHDGIFIEGVKDVWSDITLARSSDGKSLEIDYKQYTYNDSTDMYIQQSQGELNVHKQYDYKAPFYRVEKLALQDADDGTTTIFNLGMNAKAGTADSTAGFKEKISAVEFDTSVSPDLGFDGENHWLVGSGKDIYDLSGLENDAVVMLTGFGANDKLQLSDEYLYDYFDYEADGNIEALFVQAGIGGDNFLDTGKDGVLVVAQGKTEGSSIDHWMILMSSDSSIAAFDFQNTRMPELV